MYKLRLCFKAPPQYSNRKYVVRCFVKVHPLPLQLSHQMTQRHLVKCQLAKCHPYT